MLRSLWYLSLGPKAPHRFPMKGPADIENGPCTFLVHLSCLNLKPPKLPGALGGSLPVESFGFQKLEHIAFVCRTIRGCFSYAVFRKSSCVQPGFLFVGRRSISMHTDLPCLSRGNTSLCNGVLRKLDCLPHMVVSQNKGTPI